MKILRKQIRRLLGGAENKKRRTAVLTALALTLLAVAAYDLVCVDQPLYSKTTAKVLSVTNNGEKAAAKSSGSGSYTQQAKAVLLNGKYKGQTIELKNTASYSGINDMKLKTGDEVFVALKESGDGVQSAQLMDFKRDGAIAFTALLFFLLLLWIGGKKGLRSLASLLINVGIIAVVIRLYLNGVNLLLLAGTASVLFTLLSVFIVSGVNRKAFSAIAATLGGTLLTMALAAAVIAASHSGGVHYEQLEYMVHAPEQVFFTEILIGTLGGIMDIAITMASSVQELYEAHPAIGTKGLMQSGMEIGRDIMGTMANTLVLAYLSGSMPMILLWLKNGFSMVTIINIDISLEIIRALTGSIGVVLSIPLSLLISILFLKRSGEEVRA